VRRELLIGGEGTNSYTSGLEAQKGHEASDRPWLAYVQCHDIAEADQRDCRISICGGTNTVWAASAPAERGKVLGLCTSGAGICAFRAARDASYSGSRADITPFPRLKMTTLLQGN